MKQDEKMRNLELRYSKEIQDDIIYFLKFYYSREYLLKNNNLFFYANDKDFKIIESEVRSKIKKLLSLPESKCIYSNIKDSEVMHRKISDKELFEKYFINEKIGVNGYKGLFLDFIKYIDREFYLISKKFSAEERQYPASYQLTLLKKCNYLESFGHHAEYITTLYPNIENIRNYISTNDTANFSPYKKVVNPTMCIHCYNELENSELKKTEIFTLKGRCSRYESENLNNYYRLEEFTMREIVFISANAEEIEEYRAKGIKIIIKLLNHLNMKVKIVSAFDPFFKDRESIKDLQLLTQAKYEILAYIPQQKKFISIGSFNLHGTHFSDAFTIKKGEKAVYSGCIAFGIERWAYAYFSQNGFISKFKKEKFEYVL